MRPIDATLIPLPIELTTPPVTKIYFVSKVANVFGGGFAQYFKVGVRVMSGDESQSIVRLDRLSSGWMGGALGASRTKKNFVGLRDELRRTFHDAGVLVDVREN